MISFLRTLNRDRIDFLSDIEYTKNTNPKIPRIIHQTYPTKKLPSEIIENIRNLKRLNPNWEFRFYDDSDIEKYIKKEYPYFFRNYRSINPKYGAARADLFRYLLIYKEGGCYLDIKSYFLKPLDNILNEMIILSHWDNVEGGEYEGWGKHPEIKNPNGEFQQCFIISPSGHPFLKAVIQNVILNIESYTYYKNGYGGLAVLRLTGPIAYTLAITRLLEQFDYQILENKEMGFIYSIYSPISKKTHLELFKTHYTSCDEPIVFNFKSLFDYFVRKKIIENIKKIKKKIRSVLLLN
jgi:mannosyltransferase OCH1-like enzyme